MSSLVKYLKVVGSGPFPIPGERGRLARAAERADELCDMIKILEDSAEVNNDLL